MKYDRRSFCKTTTTTSFHFTTKAKFERILPPNKTCIKYSRPFYIQINVVIYVERESLLLLPFQVLGHHPVPADGRAQGLPVHGRAGPQGQVWGQPRKVEGHVVAVEHADRRDGSPYVRHIWLIFQSCNFHLSFWAKFWWNIPFSVNFSQFNDKLQRQKLVSIK